VRCSGCVERGKQDSISLNDAPDRFLVITQTGFPSTLLIGEENWRSDGTFLLSLSEHRDLEEAMLLMSACSWDTNCPGDICSGTGPESGECDFTSTELR
jgi:PHD/YefM family antitoxin component YafN of YafNO toxin-antitoxin module